MIPVLTSAQMREVDRRAIEDAGIPGRVLMEHAGRALAARARRRLPAGSRVGVVCGSGANGGDGFVAARFLDHWGFAATVYLACAPSRIRGDAAAAYGAATRCGIRVETLDGPSESFAASLREHELLVDCLLGTGAKGAPREFFAWIIEAMNDSPADILACDLPSGVDGDTGAVPGAAIQAVETLTIGHMKIGLLLHPGAARGGALHVADIGFPRDYVRALPPAAHVIEFGDAASRLPKRPADGHKGTFGRALILAGSAGMTGAASLSAEAALRAGAGLVTVATAASALPTVAAAVPEATTVPLAETAAGSVTFAAAADILAATRGCSAFAVGPGLSGADETARLVRFLLRQTDVALPPLVLDADALNVVAPLTETGVRFPPGSIITPHPGEMARLVGRSIGDVQRGRIEVAKDVATRHETTVVLKGAPTAIADPNGEVYLNPTGNAGMATGGSGDVLTGLLAGLLAQGVTPTDAAILGVYVHGLAGDLAAKELGRGLLAGDILRAIPRALMAVERATESEAI